MTNMGRLKHGRVIVYHHTPAKIQNALCLHFKIACRYYLMLGGTTTQLSVVVCAKFKSSGKKLGLLLPLMRYASRGVISADKQEMNRRASSESNSF